jgi:hypothetical protein
MDIDRFFLPKVCFSALYVEEQNREMREAKSDDMKDHRPTRRKTKTFTLYIIIVCSMYS